MNRCYQCNGRFGLVRHRHALALSLQKVRKQIQNRHRAQNISYQRVDRFSCPKAMRLACSRVRRLFGLDALDWSVASAQPRAGGFAGSARLIWYLLPASIEGDWGFSVTSLPARQNQEHATSRRSTAL